MKILYSWLKDFIDVDLSPEELAKKLTDLGIEVASVETTGADFEGVHVAQITKIEDHPNSDHLHLVTLDKGNGVTQRVVCGAPNVAVGQKVPLARVGARLGKIVLKPAVIRGVESEGMICSSDELGLTHTRAHGILVLDENLELGTDVSTLYGKADTIFELEITSNRPDLLSHLGVARELGVLLNKPVKLPQIKDIPGQGPALPVEIQNAEGCGRYIGRIIRGVKNGLAAPCFLEFIQIVGGLSVHIAPRIAEVRPKIFEVLDLGIVKLVPCVNDGFPKVRDVLFLLVHDHFIRKVFTRQPLHIREMIIDLGDLGFEISLFTPNDRSADDERNNEAKSGNDPENVLLYIG